MPCSGATFAAALRRCLSAVAVLVVLCACAVPGPRPTWPAAGSESHLLAVDERGIAACRLALQSREPVAVGALDASDIRLVNWNVKKTSLPHWRDDYARLTRGKDLILIQEASLRAETITDLPAAPHWSFAPGYLMDDAITGVLTLSRVEPLTRCNFVTVEPLLRTPKATSVTQFSLGGRRETLLVVNMNAVNFSFGLGTYKRQFELVAGVLAGHHGPVILSGDLNTWRNGRMDTVEALAAAFDLEALAFTDDRRTRFLGRPVDHIYVRGLKATSVNAIDVTSSDHNPLSVTLAM
jgi:endonuclease/exonuclease/phosphatase (EEP) superfamily protein YafD